MEPECSWPHSQVSATFPHTEPARSSHCPTTQFLKIHLNIIFPSTPGSSKWSLSLRFPHQNIVYISALSHTCYMTRPSHSSRFVHLKILGVEYRYTKITIKNIQSYNIRYKIRLLLLLATSL